MKRYEIYDSEGESIDPGSPECEEHPHGPWVDADDLEAFAVDAVDEFISEAVSKLDEEIRRAEEYRRSASRHRDEAGELECDGEISGLQFARRLLMESRGGR